MISLTARAQMLSAKQELPQRKHPNCYKYTIHFLGKQVFKAENHLSASFFKYFAHFTCQIIHFIITLESKILCYSTRQIAKTTQTP